MNPDTAATLQALQSIDWFHAVGRADSPRTRNLGSWQEAAAACATAQWDEIRRGAIQGFRTRALDRLRGITAEQRRELDLRRIREEVMGGIRMLTEPPPLPETFPEWDEAERMLQPVVHDLVQEKTRELVVKVGLPRLVASVVTSDILNLGMECEFSQFLPAGFFTAISYYYAQGHFPCGWEGSYPAGRLVVY